MAGRQRECMVDLFQVVKALRVQKPGAILILKCAGLVSILGTIAHVRSRLGMYTWLFTGVATHLYKKEKQSFGPEMTELCCTTVDLFSFKLRLILLLHSLTH